MNQVIQDKWKLLYWTGSTASLYETILHTTHMKSLKTPTTLQQSQHYQVIQDENSFTKQVSTGARGEAPKQVENGEGVFPLPAD